MICKKLSHKWGWGVFLDQAVCTCSDSVTQSCLQVHNILQLPFDPLMSRIVRLRDMCKWFSLQIMPVHCKVCQCIMIMSLKLVKLKACKFFPHKWLSPGDFLWHNQIYAGIRHLLNSLKHELRASNSLVKVHNVSPGMVLTSLLLDGATVKNKFFFNILCVLPETSAAFMVPRIRSESL